MTPEQYIQSALDAGTLTVRHIEYLTRYFQDNAVEAHDLAVDGKPGPVTIAAIEKRLPPEVPLGERLLSEAETYYNRGESGGNNSGPFIKEMERFLNWGWLNEPKWCALFVSFVIKKVTGSSIGCSASALRLGEYLLESKRAQNVHTLCLKPGDILIWNRGGGKGHTGFFSYYRYDGTVCCMEGNVGKYPAKVGFFNHDLGNEPPEYCLRMVK